MSGSLAPRLVVLDNGKIADLAGAQVHRSTSPGSTLHVTQKSRTYVLEKRGFHGLLHGEEISYKELSRHDAARWMIRNGIDVPPGMLEGIEIL